MKHTLILWASALLLTFLTGYIHSGTDKSYPITGTIGIGEKKVSYKFDKIFNDKGNYTFIIRSDNPDINVLLKWKKEDEKDWKTIELKNSDEALAADIPRQKAGTEILYLAEIIYNKQKFTVPDKPVKLLFQGYIPSMINLLNFITLFGGILLSFRTGLSALGGFSENKKIKKLTLFTVAFFFAYTIAVTPLRKSYELDAINKKVVDITSLFDIYSLILFILWILAMIFSFKGKDPRKSALIFSILTVLVFLFVRI